MRSANSLILLLCITVSAVAEEPELGPAIDGYGPAYRIENRDVALEKAATYRAVFDVASYSKDTSQISRRLVSVARFLNMHARNGTPIGNMDLAVVEAGYRLAVQLEVALVHHAHRSLGQQPLSIDLFRHAAVKTALTKDAYNRRYNSDNPNLELLNRLHDAGVRFYICGQSMAFGGVKKDELAMPVQVALSAMTMLTVLQNDGYALLPD